MYERDQLGGIRQRCIGRREPDILRYDYVAGNQLVERNLFGKWLVVVNIDFAMFGFAAAYFFLGTATTTFTFFLLAVKSEILENLAAEMIRDAGATYIGGKQAYQYKSDKFLHEEM